VWSKFLLYFHTLKYLRWTQIRYRIYYILRAKWRKLTNFKYDFEPDFPKVQSLTFSSSINSYTSFKGQDTFCFLNLEKEFLEDKIDWNHSEYGKLWTYNLNYFEFLHQENIDKKVAVSLIQDFVNKINQSKDGLEPFPISLRILFWTRFFIKEQINDATLNQFLYAQAKILAAHCEYHLMGNHLLENGFGLLFVAYYFNDKQLYKKAKLILEDELEEQILEDGAHFELSPMYHQLMLYRVLDCLNLVKNNPTIFDKELFKLLHSKAELMLSWLDNISWQNKEVPHLNDSTNGIAPTTKDLIQYAARLDISTLSIPLSDSGYRKFVNAKIELIVDAGKIGPNYIPGHAHSDSLAFVLRMNNKDFIIDTAISTYEKNALRHSERCTSAHNTVQVENAEQSEVWGGFRVAKRAKTTHISESENSISASHDGYRHLGIIHQRKFNTSSSALTINDELSKEGNAIARFHLAPNLVPTIKDNKVEIETGVLVFEGYNKIIVEDYQSAQGFNKQLESKRICVFFDKNLKTEIRTI